MCCIEGTSRSTRSENIPSSKKEWLGSLGRAEFREHFEISAATLLTHFDSGNSKTRRARNQVSDSVVYETHKGTIEFGYHNICW